MPEIRSEVGPGRLLPTIDISLPAVPPTIHCERSYHILSQQFRVRFTSAEQEGRVGPVLAHLQTPVRTAATLDILALDTGHALLLDGRPVARCASLAELAPLVSAILFNECFRNEARLMVLHAAAVGDGHGALLMPARGGWGKTSLTAALVHSGFRYLSDDSVLLRQGTLHVAGVPFSLCVKPAGLDALAAYYPDLATMPLHRRPDGKMVRYLTPRNGAFEAARQRDLPVRWILYPRYVAEAPTALRPIRGPEALRRLTSCCAPPTRLDRRTVSSLVDWIKGAACYELSISHLPTAVDLLRKMLSGRGSSPPGGPP